MQKLNGAYASTAHVIDIALKRAAELKIKDFVIASCTGKTAEIFLSRLEYFIKSGAQKSYINDPVIDKDKIKNKNNQLNIVCVTHQIGFTEPNKDEMEPSKRSELENKGVKLLTATHLLAGVDRALRFQFKGVYPAEIVSSALRIFGQGMKVCIEISIMAADAGLIKAYNNNIAFGGSGSGADTAAVICAAHSQSFFETRVREIICKPYTF